MYKCNFCGKTANETSFMIESEISKNIFICNHCIDEGYRLGHKNSPEENPGQKSQMDFNKEITPEYIKNRLDEFVIGQDKAKKILSVAVYNHYKRISHNNPDVLIEKSNILMSGPTGSGKTLLAKTLAMILDVPFVIADATTLTEAGYIGEDVETILYRLYKESGSDIESTQKGVVYIDEIDKLSSGSVNALSKSVAREGVQQALLKMIEGNKVDVPVSDSKISIMSKTVTIDTSNILFICGGAFAGMKKEEKTKKNPLGFTGITSSGNEEVKKDDYKNYGIIPELIGRLPVTVELEPLSKKALVEILTKPKNAIIKQYSELFKIDGIDLTFDKDALELIADKACENHTGARGLRSIIEDTMNDIMFFLPSHKDIRSFTVTKDIVENGFTPVCISDYKEEKTISNKKKSQPQTLSVETNLQPTKIKQNKNK